MLELRLFTHVLLEHDQDAFLSTSPILNNGHRRDWVKVEAKVEHRGTRSILLESCLGTLFSEVFRLDTDSRELVRVGSLAGFFCFYGFAEPTQGKN